MWQTPFCGTFPPKPSRAWHQFTVPCWDPMPKPMVPNRDQLATGLSAETRHWSPTASLLLPSLRPCRMLCRPNTLQQ